MKHRTAILAGAVTSIVLLVAIAVTVAMASASSSGPHARVVTTAMNTQLGTKILVTTSGRTLYSLSVERKGHFICANQACLSVWHPLVVRAGVKPTGASGLGWVTRPGGAHQVAFHGSPLYTFSGDMARGDAKGEGFKDVGVWHAARVGSAAPASPATTTTSGGGGYGGYGY